MTVAPVYKQGWAMDDVHWSLFDLSQVEPALLSAVKAAALVEYNAPDYVIYLKRIFANAGEKILADLEQWGREEAQHGRALGRWAEMAVPANDFTKDDWIHARQAILRGVENGFAVVRSAFSGLETVSDAQGRVLASAKTDHFGMIVIRAKVPLGPGPTLYTRIGDVFAWACVALSLGLAAMLLKKRRGQV